jgi:predicted Zn-dependent protease
MKEKILQTLNDLRSYALKKGYDVSLLYHEEDSSLMRFANSAISLNTREHLIRLDITAHQGRRQANYGMITDLNKIEEMKQGIDTAAEMVKHAMPLNYEPTLTVFKESFADEQAYDPDLAKFGNPEKLKYFNQVVQGLETDDLRLAGILSSGESTLAQINTRSEHTQYFRMTDAQVTAVLAHARLKWEVIAEQSAQKRVVLDPVPLQKDLAFLVAHYQEDEPQQVPLGTYDIVFGTAATAEFILFFGRIGFNGGMMKRGYSFLSEEQVGKQVFSSKFTLVDDPQRLETFPFKRDLTGMERKRHPLFKQGHFQGFIWSQDDADEFGAKPTGHTVMHRSQVLEGGDTDVNTLEELTQMPREKDLLYIPYLHYMNIVNPSKAIVTGSSRFGALLLKKDGSIVVPYNVRLTQSLLDVFGEKVAWLSRQTEAYNLSISYGARNPIAFVVPKYMQVNDLEISHSNSSY